MKTEKLKMLKEKILSGNYMKDYYVSKYSAIKILTDKGKIQFILKIEILTVLKHTKYFNPKLTLQS